MSDRPTPRTDAVNCEDGLLLESRYDKMHDLAEELERELAAAHEECDEQTRLIGMSWKRRAGLLAEIDRMKRELADKHEQISSRNKRLDHMRIERDNAESDRRQAEADTLRALHERNEARGQKWRLAEACRWAQRELGKHTRPSPIDKALDSLKGVEE